MRQLRVSLRSTLAFAFAGLAACLLVLPAAASDHERGSRIVVHIGHATDDLHAASMGMSLARMLQQKGGSVTVFLDREGVRLVDDDMPKDLGWGAKADPVVEIVADFVKAGGQILLCPHCAAAAGVEADDLVAGARIARDAEVAELFLNADRVIDY